MLFSAPYSMVDKHLTKNTVVLDYGCGSGEFLQGIGDRIGKGIGVDLDPRLIERAVDRNQFSHVKYLQGDAKGGLPFDSGYFDLIVATGVLEHVGPERPYIREFHRLVRNDGRLFIDVPSNGPFMAFDIGNIKYDCPRVHKWFYYHVARQRKYYDEHFGPNAPMYGQFSKDAVRHKHYSAKSLATVVAPCFEMESHRHYGLFFELIQFIEVLACRPFGRKWGRVFGWLMRQDCKLQSPIACANIVAMFRKRPNFSTSP